MKLGTWIEREAEDHSSSSVELADVEFAQNIADKLVDARIRANLTQVELAVRAGTTQARISEIESGDGNPTIETLAKIFAALGLTLDIAVKSAGIERATSSVATTSTEDFTQTPANEIVITTRFVEQCTLRAERRKNVLITFDDSAYSAIYSVVTKKVERVA